MLKRVQSQSYNIYVYPLKYLFENFKLIHYNVFGAPRLFAKDNFTTSRGNKQKIDKVVHINYVSFSLEHPY